jgi:hypothetical protein
MIDPWAPCAIHHPHPIYSRSHPPASILPRRCQTQLDGSLADISSSQTATRLRRTAHSAPVTTRAHASPPHVLPADLPSAIKHLDNQEFDRLVSAVVTEQKRRGKKLPVSDENSRKRKVEAAAVPLTQGKLNAVRAAFKAGVTPSRMLDSSAFPNRMCGRRWHQMNRSGEHQTR